MKSLRLFCFAVLFGSALSSKGQGWERNFPGQSLPYAVQATPDGGAVLLTTRQDANSLDRDLVVTKTDADGHTQWQKMLGGAGDDVGRSLTLTLDHNALVVAGKKSLIPNNGDVWMAALAMDGETLWQKTYNFGVLDDPCCLRSTPDGGFILALEADDQLRLLKMDALGEETWSLAYPQTLGETVENLETTPDGGYVVTLLRSNPPIAAPIAVVLKTDAAGEVGFSTEFQHFTSYGTTEIARCKPVGTNGYWLAHRDSLYRLDATGHLTDTCRIASPNNFYLTDVVPAEDGGLWALGTDYTYNPPSSRLWLGRLNADASLIWSRNLVIPNYSHSTWAMARHPDGGFFLTGNFIQNGVYQDYLLLTDSLGQIFSNQITGQVFWDQNQNCQPEPGELPLAGWAVAITHPNGEIHYATTDSLGHYAAPAGLGTYTVSVVTPNALWAAVCAQEVETSFDTTFSTANVSFPIQSTADCPLTRVDAGAPDWLPCVENEVVVRFANEGTATALNAAVTLTLDSLLMVSGASIPMELIGPFAWQFQLGDLLPQQSGTFSVQVVPACSGLVNGQSKCLRVDIVPDTPCLDPLDGPLIQVEGHCDGDTVRFRVQNKGAGMTDPLDFIVIEDNIMFLQGQFHLNAGQDTTFGFPANGSTWRFEGHQGAGTPDWQSDPVVAAVVEVCSTGSSFSMGFVNQFSLFDGGNFSEYECREVVDAPGGLAKVAYPSGYETQHFIAANTDLEYALYFQNTGVDTVHFATLRDTLDATLLAPATVVPGPSSHAYLFTINDLGVLTFRFDSIELLPGERGWVKFRVSQWSDLPQGTVIRNRAWLGLDYGVSTATNETFHTVTGSLLAIKSGLPVQAAGQAAEVWPVPASESIQVRMQQEGRYRIELRDLQGRLVQVNYFSGKAQVLPLRQVPAGVFVLLVWQEGRLINTTRIIKTN